MLKLSHKSEIFKNLEIKFINDDLIKEIFISDNKNDNLITEFLYILNNKVIQDLKISGVDGECYRYAGHQGKRRQEIGKEEISQEKVFSILGDGRVLHINKYFKNNKKIKIVLKDLDITIKGIGRTPLAKDQKVFIDADGYMTMRSAINNFKNTELLNKLKIKTERVLAVLKTNQDIIRHNTQTNTAEIHSGAIIIRISKPLVRLGTLEYLAHNQNYKEIIKILYNIQNISFDQLYKNSYKNVDQNIIKKSFKIIEDNIIHNFNQNKKVFTHNMLNTDNISIFGENIDTDTGVFYHNNKTKNKTTIKSKNQDDIDILFALKCLNSIKNVTLENIIST